MKPPSDARDNGTPDVSRETSQNGDVAGFEPQLAELLEDLGHDAEPPQTGQSAEHEVGHQVDQLVRYGQWLCGEAIAAGGLGPAECTRIFDRHLADSLMYLRGLDDPRSSILDVGSGVGLPGIPLAIARPLSHVTILDRSARRTRLSQRAVRILRLDNVDVETLDVRQMEQRTERRFDAVVFRASLPVSKAARAFQDLTKPHGVGLVGVSRLLETPSIPQPPSGVHFSLAAEESSVLDSPFWLLRMRTT